RAGLWQRPPVRRLARAGTAPVFQRRQAQAGPITRRGDTHLRALLVQGARSALQAALRRSPARHDWLSAWIVQLAQRVGYHNTLVAIANKHARIIWALLAREQALNLTRATTH